MDEAFLVRRVQGVGDLLEDVDRALRLECAFVGHELREVGALDIAHGEEQHAVVVACVEDRNDVGMVERSRDPRLPKEALTEAVVLGELGGDHLERDLSPELDLLRPVDGAHPSATDECLDPVPRKQAADDCVGAPPNVHRASVDRAVAIAPSSATPG